MITRAFYPLGDNVLVLMLEREVSSPGGIVLPERAQEASCTGVVIGVGPGKPMDKGEIRPVQVSVGSLVVLKTYGGRPVGQAIELAGKKHIVVSELDILGVMK